MRQEDPEFKAKPVLHSETLIQSKQKYIRSKVNDSEEKMQSSELRK